MPDGAPSWIDRALRALESHHGLPARALAVRDGVLARGKEALGLPMRPMTDSEWFDWLAGATEFLLTIDPDAAPDGPPMTEGAMP